MDCLTVWALRTSAVSSFEERSAHDRRCLGPKGDVGGVEADGTEVEYPLLLAREKIWKRRAVRDAILTSEVMREAQTQTFGGISTNWSSQKSIELW